jgi:site-specific DNA recombinase
MQRGGTKLKAAGYARVSTDEQVAEGVSLENQESRIRAYAESQGWELLRIYREEGYSGRIMERPELQRMLQDIRAGGIGVVLVYKVDRLTRRQKDLWTLLEDEFEPNGVGFKSVVEPFDTTTASGKAFLGMLGVFAQLERDTIAERTKDALAMKSRNGEYLGSPPLGFKATEGRLEPVEGEMQVVRRVRELHRKGRARVSFRKVAEELNKEGLRTKRGRRFHASTVSYLLHNQRYSPIYRG